MLFDKFEGDSLKKKQEYLNACVAMLCDPRARDTQIMFDHLRDVTQEWSARMVSICVR